MQMKHKKYKTTRGYSARKKDGRPIVGEKYVADGQK